MKHWIEPWRSFYYNLLKTNHDDKCMLQKWDGRNFTSINTDFVFALAKVVVLASVRRCRVCLTESRNKSRPFSPQSSADSVSFIEFTEVLTIFRPISESDGEDMKEKKLRCKLKRAQAKPETCRAAETTEASIESVCTALKGGRESN